MNILEKTAIITESSLIFLGILISVAETRIHRKMKDLSTKIVIVMNPNVENILYCFEKLQL